MHSTLVHQVKSWAKSVHHRFRRFLSVSYSKISVSFRGLRPRIMTSDVSVAANHRKSRVHPLDKLQLLRELVDVARRGRSSGEWLSKRSQNWAEPRRPPTPSQSLGKGRNGKGDHTPPPPRPQSARASRGLALLSPSLCRPACALCDDRRMHCHSPRCRHRDLASRVTHGCARIPSAAV